MRPPIPLVLVASERAQCRLARWAINSKSPPALKSFISTFLSHTCRTFYHPYTSPLPTRGAPARRCVPRSPATSPARARAVPGAPCRARAGPPRPVPGPCPGPVPSAGPVPGRVARARPVPGGPCRVPCRVPGPCRATCPERIYRAGTPVPAVPGPRPGTGPSCRHCRGPSHIYTVLSEYSCILNYCSPLLDLALRELIISHFRRWPRAARPLDTS